MYIRSILILLAAAITFPMPVYAADASVPLEMLDSANSANDLPSFWTTKENAPDSPSCEDVEMRPLDELFYEQYPEWRSRIAATSMIDCSISSSYGAYISTDVQFNPGQVTLGGLPVSSAEDEYMGYSFVLDVPMKRALAVLRPILERNCLDDAKRRADDDDGNDCKMHTDGISWSMGVYNGEYGSYDQDTITLSPDSNSTTKLTFYSTAVD